MKLQIKKGSTDVTLLIFIQDSSSTTGAVLTGLVYNSASLVCYYARPLAAAAVQALATQTVTGAHSDGGFKEISSTNMPGVYRLDLKDLVVATGVDSVVAILKGATNMAPLTLEIALVDNIAKDTYDIVNHASYGNAKLVRSTTPGNTLDVDASGYVTAENMRGTDNAALAVVCTEARLAELDAGNIPADLIAIAAHIDTEVAAIKTVVEHGTYGNSALKTLMDTLATAAALATAQADLDTITGADGVTLATAQGNYAPLKGGTAMTESYAADGAAATPEQILYMIYSVVAQNAVTGTAIKTYKLDGTTQAMAFTTDDAANPTLRDRTA